MRLIDADALMEYCNNLKDKTIDANDIARFPTAVGWISVKDGLPEDEGDVLVYGVSPRGRKKTAIMNYLAFEADRPRWALDGIWTVLYWMPIPEPPKEEKPECD